MSTVLVFPLSPREESLSPDFPDAVLRRVWPRWFGIVYRGRLYGFLVAGMEVGCITDVVDSSV